MRAVVTFAAATLVALAPPLALAQTAQPLAKPGCSQAPVEAATQPSTGGASGTAPGGSGSTGWSGAGQGGSYSGTVPAGPIGSSPSYQPVTAKGLDPTKSVAARPAGC